MTALLVLAALFVIVDFFGDLDDARARSLILRLLAAGDMRGQELVDASGGRLKRGTLYVHLSRLESDGLVSSEVDRRPNPSPEGILPRRRYRLTDKGRRAPEASS